MICLFYLQDSVSFYDLALELDSLSISISTLLSSILFLFLDLLFVLILFSSLDFVYLSSRIVTLTCFLGSWLLPFDSLNSINGGNLGA